MLCAGFPASGAEILRIATFNASLNRAAAGELVRGLQTSGDRQAAAVAAIIRSVRPDVLLINEFDYDARGEAATLFRRNYLETHSLPGFDSVPAPTSFPFAYAPPSNTGEPTGQDLNRDGRIAGGEDARGFGAFPGQYGMLILSRFPIDTRRVRSFANFLWRDMPGALLPDDIATPAPNDWYSTQALADLPLSSKNHVDVPIRIGATTIHLLASHPTPPSFDGPEDRNGRRNHDEIRFWTDYLSGATARYAADDRGDRSAFRGRHFVVLGDLNSDPHDAGSRHEAIRDLLAHARVSRGPTPASEGGPEAALLQAAANAKHHGDPRFDTSDFNDRTIGNLRVDYVLPSRSLRICASGVFWPRTSDPQRQLLGTDTEPTSDHRLVWVDVSLSGRCKSPQ